MAAERVQAVLGKTWGNRDMPPRTCLPTRSENCNIERSAALSKRFTMSLFDVMPAATNGRGRLISHP